MKDIKKIISLLEQVKEELWKEPESYDQNTFIHRTECGTVHCIAGILGEILVKNSLKSIQFPNYYAEKQIIQLFEVNVLNDIWLFGMLNRWPEDLQILYKTAKKSERATIACIAINRYIREISD